MKTRQKALEWWNSLELSYKTTMKNNYVQTRMYNNIPRSEILTDTSLTGREIEEIYIKNNYSLTK